MRNLPQLLIQDLLDNTAVSGSNEGIIRIWEISSEKFVRWFKSALKLFVKIHLSDVAKVHPNLKFNPNPLVEI